MLRRFASVLAVGGLCLLGTSAVAFAQVSGAGSISGRVTDQSKAMLPGVQVAVTNTETGVAREVITNERGQFIVPNLQAGRYQISAELQGFQPARMTDLMLNVGQSLDLQIQLSITTLQQEVTVAAEAPVVNTSQAYSSVVNERSIKELPLNGRRWEDLALLTPGVVRARGTISVGGLEARGMNSFNIDGLDFNTSMFGMSRGGNRPPFQMSQDAVKEFQVMTNSYSAEFGRVGGGVINAVTKSGTNELRGATFYYFRDAAFLARNAFATTRPSDDRRQQFGGSLGGPLRKGKLFFFVNTDNQRHSNPVIVNAGDALNNVRNVTQADIAAALNRFRNDPAFDQTMTPDQGWRNFQEARAFIERELGTHPRRFDQITFFPRIDWTINGRFNLNIRYNYQDFDSLNGVVAGAGGGAVITRAVENTGTAKVKTHSLGMQLNTILGSSTVLETKAQVAHDDQPDTVGRGINSEVRNIPSEIRLTDGRVFQFGSLNFLPRDIRETRYQFIQTATHLRGAHTLRAGMDINIVDQDNLQTRTLRGQYNFTNLVNFAIGAYRTFLQNLGDPKAPQVAVDYAGYLQDDWKPRPNLAVNLGLRYDLQTFTLPKQPNPLVAETSRIPVDKNNFGPRVGLSWFPGSKPRTIVRTGYGLFYVRTLTVDTEIMLYRNGVTRQLVTFLGPDNAAGSDARAPVFPNIFDQTLTLQQLGLPPNTVEVGLAASNRVNGEVQHANVTIERLITPTMSASIGWLFLKGTHLTGKIHENVGGTPLRFRDVPVVDATNRQIGTVRNVPDYDAARNRPNPQLGDLFVNRSEFNSEYHALAVTVNKRFSQNYQFTLAYTWSKVIDDNPQQEGADISAPFGQKGLNRGPSDSDQRHRLVWSGTFHQPSWEAKSPRLRAIFNGWQLGAILAFESAFPFNPLTSTALTRIRSGDQLAPADINGPYVTYGRNSFRGFRYVQNDLRLTRSFDLRNKTRLEFIAEAFNITNRTNLLGPSTTRYTYSARATFTNTAGAVVQAERLQVNPSFGGPSGAEPAREFQFALRLTF
jgi:hypothetical protein